MVRAAVIGAVIMASCVLVFGPWTYVLVTGRPVYVDCGGYDAAACEEAWHEASDGSKMPDGLGPITWARFDGTGGGFLCGENTFGHWWPAFDPFAITGYGLC